MFEVRTMQIGTCSSGNLHHLTFLECSILSMSSEAMWYKRLFLLGTNCLTLLSPSFAVYESLYPSHKIVALINAATGILGSSLRTSFTMWSASLYLPESFSNTAFSKADLTSSESSFVVFGFLMNVINGFTLLLISRLNEGWGRATATYWKIDKRFLKTPVFWP